MNRLNCQVAMRRGGGNCVIRAEIVYVKLGVDDGRYFRHAGDLDAACDKDEMLRSAHVTREPRTIQGVPRRDLFSYRESQDVISFF